MLEQFRICDQKGVLGHRPQATGYGRFLESIATDRGCRDLPADYDNGCGIGHAIAYRRGHIGGSGTGSNHGDTHLTAGAGVSRCHETGALLVGRHDQWHGFIPVLVAMFSVITEHGVISREDGSATVAEYGVNTCISQHLDHHIGAGHGIA